MSLGDLFKITGEANLASCVSSPTNLAQHLNTVAPAEQNFRVPFGLFLVIDEANGGDRTAVEVVRRMHLVDRESRHYIHFAYCGWRKASDRKSIAFDLDSFMEWRKALKKWGIDEFSGNADLILLDAERDGSKWKLYFDDVMSINLSAVVGRNGFSSVGEFLQAVIKASQDAFVEESKGNSITGALLGSRTGYISDKMVYSSVKESAVAFFLQKFGAAIGGKKLARLVTRRKGKTIAI